MAAKPRTPVEFIHHFPHAGKRVYNQEIYTYMKSKYLEPSTALCGHCKTPLIWKTHLKITEKQLRQPFYFSRWEYCTTCKTTWFHEKHKIWNKNDRAAFIKETQPQLEFIRNIR